MDPALPALEVLGVRVARLTTSQALDELARLHDGPTPQSVAFVNAHTLNLAHQDPAFRDLLNQTGLVLNDGAGVSLAARWQRSSFPENLNGTDLTPRILALAAGRGWPVYLLGGKPRVAESAAAALRSRQPDLQIAGTGDGYFPPEASPRIAETIRRSGASLLLVALGNPLQEQWLHAHLAQTGCRLGVAVGAFFDFAAQVVPRAPSWMRQIGVEWVYRLGREPGRMWRRYLLGNPLFLARVVLNGRGPSARAR